MSRNSDPKEYWAFDSQARDFYSLDVTHSIHPDRLQPAARRYPAAILRSERIAGRIKLASSENTFRDPLFPTTCRDRFDPQTSPLTARFSFPGMNAPLMLVSFIPGGTFGQEALRKLAQRNNFGQKAQANGLLYCFVNANLIGTKPDISQADGKVAHALSRNLPKEITRANTLP